MKKEFVVEIIDNNESDVFIIVEAESAEEAENIAMFELGYEVLYAHERDAN